MHLRHLAILKWARASGQRKSPGIKIRPRVHALSWHMKYNCKNRVDHVVSTVDKFCIYFAIWCPATKDVSSGVAESLHDMCQNWYLQLIIMKRA